MYLQVISIIRIAILCIMQKIIPYLSLASKTHLRKSKKSNIYNLIAHIIYFQVLLIIELFYVIFIIIFMYFKYAFKIYVCDAKTAPYHN